MMTNAEIADILRQHADLLEIAGGNGFRINAFRRAADAVRAHHRSVAGEDDLTSIPGVGAGIAAAITEVVQTGRFSEFEELQETLPGSLLSMLDIPGLGAKRVTRFYRELSITSINELEEAAQSGRLTELKGIGAKAQTQILEGIAFLRSRTDRILIGTALPLAEHLTTILADRTGKRVEIAGSVRRMCETVGNIDLLAIADDPEAILNAAATLDDVAAVREQQGDTALYSLQQGIDLRLHVASPERTGTAWIAMTGSAEHLSALGGAEALPEAESEAACYAALGLGWIPPELRENRGELDAAREGRIPRLIEAADLLGDLHLHTIWSDGAGSLLDMAAAAATRGYTYLAITDHSGGLGIAGGLDVERLAWQRAEIDSVAGEAPVRLLAGSEVEVHRDGRLDFTDDVLAGLDLVVASLHSGTRQDTETITSRICTVLRNPHVDIIAHPTGRLIERRQGADYDWPRVLDTARDSATALEINSDPARLDMNEHHARMAREAGVLITIDSDAHHPEALALVRYGVALARRAWIEPQQVINTWPLDDVLAWLRERRIAGAA